MCFDPWARYLINPDHRAAAYATYDACSFSHFHLYFEEQLKEGLQPHLVTEMYLYNTDSPNLEVDVTNYVDKRVAALLAYDSQVDLMFDECREGCAPWAWMRRLFEKRTKKEITETIVKNLSGSPGRSIGLCYTEKFKVLPLYLAEIVPFLQISPRMD